MMGSAFHTMQGLVFARFSDLFVEDFDKIDSEIDSYGCEDVVDTLMKSVEFTKFGTCFCFEKSKSKY
jgi:hypothetical protein